MCSKLGGCEQGAETVCSACDWRRDATNFLPGILYPSLSPTPPSLPPTTLSLSVTRSFSLCLSLLFSLSFENILLLTVMENS